MGFSSRRGSRRRCRAGLPGALSTALVAGCGVPVDSGDEGPQEPQDFGSFAEIVLTGNAASTVSLQSGLALNFAADATTTRTEARLAEPSPSRAAELLASYQGPIPLSGPILMTPFGLSFDGEVVLTVPVATEHPYVSAVSLEDEADTSWEPYGSAALRGNRAYLPVPRFAIVMLVEPGPGQFPPDAGIPEGLEGLVEGGGP